MKKIIICSLLISVSSIQAQTSTKNYVKETVRRTSSTGSVIIIGDTNTHYETTTYFDGLGRPIQIVDQNSSPDDSKNIVTHIEYEKYIGQVKEYLPFTEVGKAEGAPHFFGGPPSIIYNSNYVEGALNKTLTFYNTPYYDNTTNPYTENRLENSPRKRVVETAFPGDDWSINFNNQSTDYRNTIRKEYSFNVANEVKRYVVSTVFSQGVYKNSISDDGFYASNQLIKSIVKNENWKAGDGNNNTIVEFKDISGKVLLKRTYNDNVPHDTYYVYNNLDLLAFVISPLANGEVSSNVLNELCYQYNYDAKKRLVEKKLPQKEWEYIIYDKADRVVMTGPVYDPWGQNTKGWLVTKYDPFGRVAYTGFYQSSNFSSSERTALSQNNFTVENKTSSNTIDGISVAYTNTSFPTSMKLLSVNYYDNYSYPNAPTTFPSIESQAVNTSVKGHATGSWTRVLTSNTSTSGNLSYNLYDNRYRPIRSYESNHLGGFIQKDSKLNFTGLPSKVTTTTKYNSSATQYSYVDNFTYDRRDRMLTHTQVIGSREEKISTLSYDPLGVLIQKKVGGLTGNLQTVDFTYNIRGWMTHINKDTADDDLFFYELNYNKDSFVPLYNGNISSNKYFTKQDYVLRGYNYYYDHLNRLVNALSIKKYGRSILEDNLYDESLSYDKNGNILTLNRNTNLSNLPHEIDNLTYEYQGNQLLKVSDSSGSPSGFKDGTNTGNDYSYDTFGNIKQDLNKNLTNITYNHLNLPVEITFANSSKINYTYDAAGTRKSKRVQPTSGAVVTTDYMNEFQYENSELQFIRHPEGYVKHNGSGQFMYVYQYKDHLGNVRLSYADIDGSETIDSASEILEENHYYPFGLKHQGYNEIANSNRSEAAEKYKYGGKEWNDELGLDLYDFHARNYDPAIGRWLNVDPVTHFEQSPYVAFDNNPVFWTDPDGADTIDPIKDSITVISSYVDKNNVTHITQTTTNTTTTFNDDGSVNISYSISSVTNTVNANGNVTKGSIVTMSSGSISKDSEGNVSSKIGSTTTRKTTSSDETSALNQWTNAVSNYNKIEGNGIFNVDKIDKTTNYTTKAGKTGVAVLGSFAGFNSLFSKLNTNTKTVVGLMGGSTSADGLIGLAGDSLKNHVGKNNSYAIIYGVQHIQNGRIIKEMKTPAGQAGGSRYSVGPSSWQELVKWGKSLFN